MDVLDIRRDFVGGQGRLRVGLGVDVEAKHLRVKKASLPCSHPRSVEYLRAHEKQILSVYFTVSGRLWLWLLNSGAYMHWIWAMPVWYWPRSWTRVEYSKT